MYGAITNGIESKALMVAKLADNSGWAKAVKSESYGTAPKVNKGIESSFRDISNGPAGALSSTGTTSKSSTIQPYTTVYLWVRVA